MFTCRMILGQFGAEAFKNKSTFKRINPTILARIVVVQGNVLRVLSFSARKSSGTYSTEIAIPYI